MPERAGPNTSLIDWDAYGRNIRSTVNPWGTQIVATNTYDEPTGRVLTQYVDKQTATTGTVQNTTYAYNQAGQITAIRTVPNNTPSATDLQCFTYDYLGRLKTAWSDTGRLEQPTPSLAGQGACANATPTSGAVAPAKTTVGGSAAYWQEYTYDLTGNRTKVVNRDPAGDPAKDLTVTQTSPAPGTRNTPTTAAGTGGGTGGPHALASTSSTYGWSGWGAGGNQYDAAGNTTRITNPGGNRELKAGFVLKSGESARSNSVQLSMQADGNFVVYAPGWQSKWGTPTWNAADSANGTSMTWDVEGKLASLTQGTATTTYVYDADGNQLVRRNPGKVTVNLGSGDELTYDTNSKVSTGTRYYGIPGGITLVRQGPTKLSYQFADHHGTNSLSIDRTTLAESRRATDPFGALRGPASLSTPWAGDKGFVNGLKDDITGFTNLGARQYQPSTGRFLSPDPILDAGDPLQWNAYAYSNNNPVNRSDPNGLKSEECGTLYKCGSAGTITMSNAAQTTGENVSESALKRLQDSAPSFKPLVPIGPPPKRSYEGNNRDFLAGAGASIIAPVSAAFKFLYHNKAIQGGDFDPKQPTILESYSKWAVSKGVDLESANFASGTYLLAGLGEGALAVQAPPARGTASADTLLRTGGKGHWAGRLPMTMDCVCEVAAKYNIDLDFRIVFDRNKRGIRGSTAPNQQVTLYSPAFKNEEQLAKTLVHEKYHVDDLRGGMPYPSTYDAQHSFELAAEAHAVQWWDSIGSEIQGG
ncbi:RHS repeat-associated core domain-containing protein [Kitasatospora sp. NPDC001527]|uniref:RHS repeat-associated core domain-containing protein n=1 Tax=Kitasatospora sp. NPDC001527 TaxID=3154519 RepID=UPI00331F37D0